MSAINRLARIAYAIVSLNGAAIAGLLAFVQRRRVW
jgi:hypothetical protein